MTALLKVNGETVDAAAAVRLSILHNGTFLRDTIRNAVIRQYAEKQGIRNSDAELQLAADELRYNRGLEAVEAVTQWMRENHQTPLAIQDGIEAMLLNNKVRNSIAEEKLQAYYAEHKLDTRRPNCQHPRGQREQGQGAACAAERRGRRLPRVGEGALAGRQEPAPGRLCRAAHPIGNDRRCRCRGVRAAPRQRHRSGQDRTGMEPLQGREDSQTDLRASEEDRVGVAVMEQLVAS